MALTTNLVSYWKFDESSGNASDSKGSNTLTNNGTTAYVSAKINNGANLVRASSRYFSISDASQSGLDITGDISVQFWMKPTATTLGTAGGNRVVAKYDTAVNGAYLFSVGGSAAGDLHVLTSNDGTSQTQGSVTPSPSFSAGTFYHVVFSLVVSTGICTIYVNAVSQGTVTGLASSIFNSSAPFYIGNRPSGGSGDLFDGVIDEVGIWSRALSSGEVTSLYNGGAGFPYPFVSGPANLKSRSGNTAANIKSISGNLIANVKSLSGNS